MARLVLVSDTHGRVPTSAIPDGDVLIHAGDYSMSGTIAETASFARWLSDLSHPVKILVPGNHDFLFEKNETVARSMMSPDTIVLIDEERIVCGLRMYGSPWQPRFYDWAFNLDRGEQIRRKWDLIPPKLDVLITHGPPWGVMDTVGTRRVGCEELRRALDGIQPRLHVFGHIHEGYGHETIGETEFYNASMCDEGYKWDRTPFVVDMEPAT